MKVKTKDKSCNEDFKRKLNHDNKSDSIEISANFEKIFFPKRFKDKKEKLMLKYFPSINFFLLGFILNIIPKIILSEDYYIKISVKQNGYNQILSDEYGGPLPSVIYIGNAIHVLRGKKIYVENNAFSIILQWDKRIENLSNMFSNLESITSVDMHYIFGDYCNLSYMFKNCKNLVNVKLSTYHYLDKIKDTIGMFYNCISLTSFNFGDLNMHQVSKNMSYMFYNCQTLNSISLTRGCDIEKINDMRGMFYNCTSLVSINLTKFKSEGSINLSYMFYNCKVLNDIQLTSDNLYANDMKSMFYNCSSLTYIDLNVIKTSNSIDVSRLFYNCTKLSTITVDFQNIYISDAREMFYNCKDLQYYKNNDINNNIIIILFNNINDKHVNMSKMFYNCQKLQSVNITGHSSNYIIPNDFNSMFYNCIQLNSVFFKFFNLDNIKNTSYMFYNCRNLKEFTRDNFNCPSPNIII